MYVESVNSVISEGGNQKAQKVKGSVNEKGRTNNLTKSPGGDTSEKNLDLSLLWDKNLDRSKQVAADRDAVNKKIKEALAEICKDQPNISPCFSVHEGTNRIMIKLVDKDTHEVIKELPPEKTLDIIAKCLEISGAMLDKKL